MKKHVLKLSLIFFAISNWSFAQPARFLSEVFTDVAVTSNVTYAQNYTFYFVPPPLTPPLLISLNMDIYEPAGAGYVDTMQHRPLIIYMHTGSYLPLPFAGPTGTRTDSAVVEMCKQFARRGYVAASIDYRIGWNASSSDQDERTGTLMQAVYRSIQDAKACVRYFKANADTGGNDYKIDTSNIILCGQGTGGYIALAYATLDDTLELQLSKFISSTTNMTPPYYFQAGFSYINQAIWGDFEGYGGNPAVNNANNSPGYSSKVQFSVNVGGALADSSWIKAGDVPMVSFHLPNDPFAPYGHGPVYVPQTPPNPPLYVVDVDGSEVVARHSNTLGNNNCMLSSPSTPYTLRADAVNNGYKGLFPFITDPSLMSAPWEWWDSTTLVNYAIAIGYPGALGTNAHLGGLATNPVMDKDTVALVYIDTIQNFANTMIVHCLSLDTTALPIIVGVKNISVLESKVSVYPNPATDKFMIDAGALKKPIQSVSIYDLSGRLTYRLERVNSVNREINTSEFASGMYFLKVEFDGGEIVKKISIQ